MRIIETEKLTDLLGPEYKQVEDMMSNSIQKIAPAMLLVLFVSAAGFSQAQENPEYARQERVVRYQENRPTIRLQCYIIEIPREYIYSPDEPILSEKPQSVSLPKILSILYGKNQGRVIRATSMNLTHGKTARYYDKQEQRAAARRQVTGKDVDPYIITEYEPVVNAIEIRANFDPVSKQKIRIQLEIENTSSEIFQAQTEPVPADTVVSHEQKWDEEIVLTSGQPGIINESIVDDTAVYLIACATYLE